MLRYTMLGQTAGLLMLRQMVCIVTTALQSVDGLNHEEEKTLE